MRYRNSECCVTPEETVSTESLSGYGVPMNWNKNDGWTPRKSCDNNNDDNWYRKNECEDKCEKKNECEGYDECENVSLMQRLTDLKFAAIDLNLYLDTHPCDEEALQMLKKVTKTMEAVKSDYIRKYGPLMACDSSEEAPFQWVSCRYKWPWEK